MMKRHQIWPWKMKPLIKKISLNGPNGHKIDKNWCRLELWTQSDVLTGGQFVLFTSNNNNWFKIDYGNTRMALKNWKYHPTKISTSIRKVIFIASLSSQHWDTNTKLFKWNHHYSKFPLMFKRNIPNVWCNNEFTPNWYDWKSFWLFN